MGSDHRTSRALIRLSLSVLLTAAVGGSLHAAPRAYGRSPEEVLSLSPTANRSRGAAFEVVASTARAASERSRGGRFELAGWLPPRGGSGLFADGFESSDACLWSTTSPSVTCGLPSGAVVFFDATTCPAGWSDLTAGRGRVLTGLPLGGSPAGTLGSPLSDLQSRVHLHLWIQPATSTSTDGSDTHHWSTLANSGIWISRDATGATQWMIDWDAGIGGSGYYPFHAVTMGGSVQYTESSGAHSHSVNDADFTNSRSGYLPYVQLLACEKD